MYNYMGRKIFVVGSLALAAVACGDNESNGDASSEDILTGETVTIIVPFSTGGGTDVTARFLAPLLGEQTPGSPNFQVENVPGGGGVLGVNQFVMQGDDDGTRAVFTSGSSHVPYVLGEEGVQYDLVDLIPVMANPVGNVMYIDPDMGVEEPQDLVGAEGLVYAGIGATGPDLAHLLTFELLGVDVQTVLGYDGSGAVRVAFEQGESNLNYDTTPGYLTGGGQELVEAGDALMLYTIGQLDDGEIVRDPYFPDLPTVPEVYEEIHGEWPEGEAYEAYKTIVGFTATFSKALWMHPDAPEAAVEAVRQGAADTIAEDGFIESSTEALGGYDPLIGEELEDATSVLVDVDPATVDWLTDWLETEHDVTVN